MQKVMQCERCHATVPATRVARARTGQHVCYPCLAELAAQRCERCQTSMADADATTTADGRRICWACAADLMEVDVPRPAPPPPPKTAARVVPARPLPDVRLRGFRNAAAVLVFAILLGGIFGIARWERGPRGEAGDDAPPLRVFAEPHDAAWIFLTNQESAPVLDLRVIVNGEYASSPLPVLRPGRTYSVALDELMNHNGQPFGGTMAALQSVEVEGRLHDAQRRSVISTSGWSASTDRARSGGGAGPHEQTARRS